MWTQKLTASVHWPPARAPPDWEISTAGKSAAAGYPLTERTKQETCRVVFPTFFFALAVAHKHMHNKPAVNPGAGRGFYKVLVGIFFNPSYFVIVYLVLEIIWSGVISRMEKSKISIQFNFIHVAPNHNDNSCLKLQTPALYSLPASINQLASCLNPLVSSSVSI